MSQVRYSVRRAELSSQDINRGLVPGWEVVARDDSGSYVVEVVDRREVAREIARTKSGR